MKPLLKARAHDAIAPTLMGFDRRLFYSGRVDDVGRLEVDYAACVADSITDKELLRGRIAMHEASPFWKRAFFTARERAYQRFFELQLEYRSRRASPRRSEET